MNHSSPSLGVDSFSWIASNHNILLKLRTNFRNCMYTIENGLWFVVLFDTLVAIIWLVVSLKVVFILQAFRIELLFIFSYIYFSFYILFPYSCSAHFVLASSLFSFEFLYAILYIGGISGAKLS